MGNKTCTYYISIKLLLFISPHNCQLMSLSHLLGQTSIKLIKKTSKIKQTQWKIIYR